ncbi:MAG TPA: adenylyl-sulfate kinase [Methylomirabilota bacterium]|nr:adenylyl-sulfate kinase [Methylomirabilota bacterium]
MSWAIWVTGPPASGKSTVVRATARRLAADGVPVTVLELDRLRRVLTPTPTYRPAEREVVYRSLVFMAVALTEAGRPVLIDATAHRREWRDLARASIARFAEVQIECPLEVCVERERARAGGHAPRGIYAAAGRPGAAVPSVDVAYEAALSPELVLDTTAVDAQTAADRVAALALSLGEQGVVTAPPRAGAVIWLTGPPGSGKTTLASRLADALEAEGVPVTILEWEALRATALPARWATAAELDVAHRALACVAMLLADAGRTVVVDATAPRRAWRQLARALPATFAEVQLVCPADVCADRERAVRWRPRPCAEGSAVAGPESAADYEYSLSPDLIIDTATHGEWAATEALMALARRLLRRQPAREESAMKVRELMSAKPITVDPETPMLEARQRMVDERIRHLIVAEGTRVVGIVTDRDIRLNLPSPATSLSVWEINYLLAKLTVRDVMTRAVLVVDPERSAAEAARIMIEHKISALPVLDGDRLLGIVTESDFVRALARLDGAA